MKTESTEQQSLQISRESVMALVTAFVGGSRGREDDEHPLPPGPWDPVIRAALERTSVFGPHPEPWRVVFGSLLARHPEVFDAIGDGHRFGGEVALNPQPLPPRIAFLAAVAQVVVSRAEFLQDIADASSRGGEQQGIIIVGGYTSRFCDEFCGNGFKLRWPFPGPRPHWFTGELDGIDLVMMATQFEQAAKQTFSPNLRQHLAEAATRFLDAGLSKMR